MYLKYNLIILAFALGWFFIGLRRVFTTQDVYLPLSGFSRYHPRLAPLLMLALILVWPVGRWLWRPMNRMAFYIVFRFKNPKIKD